MLTKTTYLTYTQCAKAFWLEEYQPTLAVPLPPTTQRRLRTGQEVDKRAREQFPHGRLIPYRPHPEDMAPLTAQAIAEGTETLFQATFTVADLLVKVDILTKTAGGWHLIEVKSSTQYKRDQHLPDIAFQWVALQQAGSNITQASLMHLNCDCRYPLYFFDFETIDYAIPIFTGCKPYQQAPFQYSCHILDAGGTLTHCDYLHTSQDDPHPPLIHALLEHIARKMRAASSSTTPPSKKRGSKYSIVLTGFYISLQNN